MKDDASEFSFENVIAPPTFLFWAGSYVGNLVDTTPTGYWPCTRCAAVLEDVLADPM
jgi:hypothetical protein